MKCFYHRADLDGHSSGAIVKLAYPDCEMIGIDYNDDFEKTFKTFPLIEEEIVFIVDFSFPLDIMEEINNKVKLIWIDHHVSALNEMSNADFKASEGQKCLIGKAGCELTWDFVHPDEDMPLAVYLLGRYDVWDHKDKRVLPFQFGMRQFPETRPINDEIIQTWRTLFNDNYAIDKIILKGNIILDYEKSQNEKIAKGMSFETTFEGHPVIAINKPYSNSNVFESVYDPEHHDFMIIFGFKPPSFKYSLYSSNPNIDVSKIAKKYGGGGHKGAAGFYSSEMLLVK